MKQITLILTLFFFTCAYSQEFSLIQINADWNSHNDLRFHRVGDIEISYALLENQPPDLRAQITSVPTLILFKDGRIAYSWKAGIDLKCRVTQNDVLDVIDKFKD